MPRCALQFNQVRKSYGKVPVLRGLDFGVEEGSCFGLAGVNGAGKTTLIKCLLDFCAADEGEIEIFDISHLECHSRRNLCYLPEKFSPPYYLTGGDFLRCYLRLQGIGVDAGVIGEMLESLDLDVSAIEKPVRYFSKGMAQKLGLCACFLGTKDLLILDEPMSGLDPKARFLVKKIIFRLKETGKTVLFTTHSLADIDEMCDQMAVLHEGRLAFLGAPEELCHIQASGSLEAAFLKLVA